MTNGSLSCDYDTPDSAQDRARQAAQTISNRKEVFTMTIKEMEQKARELREMLALIAEAQAEADTIKDELKAAMGDRESVQAGEYKITYKTVKSSRMDTTALKKAMPDIFTAFSKESVTRRFCIA